MPHVLVAGPASWNTLVDVDALPAPRSHTVMARGHRRSLGGTSAGKALTLARLGVPVTLRTALGDDDVAERIVSALDHPLLTLAGDRSPGASEQHLNLMTPDGGRLSIYLDLPPDPGPPSREVGALLGTADVVVADLAGHVRDLLPTIRSRAREVWCDVHDHDGVAEFPGAVRRGRGRPGGVRRPPAGSPGVPRGARRGGDTLGGVHRRCARCCGSRP